MAEDKKRIARKSAMMHVEEIAECVHLFVPYEYKAM